MLDTKLKRESTWFYSEFPVVKGVTARSRVEFNMQVPSNEPNAKTI
jgi:hypothetical protein